MYKLTHIKFNSKCEILIILNENNHHKCKEKNFQIDLRKKIEITK
jgi:hypothetical protein